MSNGWMYYARSDMAFANWLASVDKECKIRFGLSLHELDPEVMSAHEFYEKSVSVGGYVDYIGWVLEVDTYCQRFLSGCHYWNFDVDNFSGENYYEEGWPPERFFVEIVVTVLLNEYPDIYTIVDSSAVWGSSRSGRI